MTMPKTAPTQRSMTGAATSRRTWLAGAALLGLAVLAELFVEHHGEGVAGSFAFSAWYGFLAAAVFIVVARLVGAVLKRREDYYDA